MKTYKLKNKILSYGTLIAIAFLSKATIIAQNNALQFDGSSNNVSITYNPTLDFSINSKFSIEAWFKTTDYTTVLYSNLVDNYPFTGTEVAIVQNKLVFSHTNTDITNSLRIETVNSYNDGNWHHFACVYKGIPNASNVDIYVDGILQAKNPTLDNLSFSTNSGNAPHIGCRNNTTYFLNGTIDELRIWGKALCSSEVTNRKNCELKGDEKNLLAYYNFNEGIASGNNPTITNLVDVSGHSNTGTLTSFALSGFMSNWIASTASLSGSCISSEPITISGNTLVCMGNSTILNGNSTASYTWSNGSTSSSISVSPSVTTIYSLSGSIDTNGCYDNAIITVSVISCSGCQFSGSELVVNGDFTIGNTGFTSGYNYNLNCASGGINGDGYSIKNYDINPVSSCYGITDRNGLDGMAIHFPDIQTADVGQVLWAETINVTQNKMYNLSLWAYEPNGNCPYQAQGTNFDVYINGVLVKADNIGGCTIWSNKNYYWNSTQDNTALIELKSGANNFNLGLAGLDPLFDGISFKQCLNEDETCISINEPKPTCSIKASNTSSLNEYTGGVITNLYLGYGADNLNLTTTVTGSSLFTYFWTGTALSVTTGSVVNFKPTHAGLYTITCTAKNSNDCTTSCSIVICVKDIRIPNQNGKVYICHFPPGNQGNPQTLSISKNSVSAHIGNHAGDALGSCNMTCGTSSKTGDVGEIFSVETAIGEVNLIVSPNPSSNIFNFMLETVSDELVNVKIYDMVGRTLLTHTKLSPKEVISIGAELAVGVYMAEITQGEFVKTVRIVKMD